MNNWSVLKITDGATTVNLIGGVGLRLEKWRPLIAEAKGGGVWQDSPLSEGRRIAFRRFGNVIETFDLIVSDADQEAVIRDTQDLRRLLEQAVNYWLDKSGAVNPVWIEARAECETNSRYAYIYDYRTPSDGEPYGQAFNPQGPPYAFDGWQLLLERGHWLSKPPVTDTCVPLASTMSDYTYGDNLVLNYSFETAGGGGADVFLNWTETAGDGAIASDGAVMMHLAASARLTSGATSNTALQQNIAVVAGATYLFSFYSRASAVVSPPRFELLNITAGGNIIPLTVVPQRAAPAWLRWSVFVTIPAGCISAGILFRCPATNGAIAYYDYVVFRRMTAVTFGRAATCLEENYIANKSGYQQLTDAFVYDAAPAGYSANLIGAALPYGILPAVPAVGDIFYAGIDAGSAYAAPFYNIVFDFTAAVVDYTGVWEYWSGAAWAAIPNAIGFATTLVPVVPTTWPTGVNMVAWQPPTAWSYTTVNGIYGWWVRFRVTAVVAANMPTQQNRQLYTVLKPMALIDDAAVTGDIPALARYVLHHMSSVSPFLEPDFLLWSRSVSRGIGFDPYLNLTDQATPILSLTGPWSIGPLPATCAYLNSTASATGRAINYAPAAADTSTIECYIATPLSDAYHGVFRVFLRTIQNGGAAADFSATLTIGSTTRVTGERVYTTTVGFNLLDLGRFQIPSQPVTRSGLTFNNIYFKIQLQNTSAAPGTLTLYELIMVPLDECTIEVRGAGTGSGIGSMELDSVFQKRMVSATNVQAGGTITENSGYTTVAHTPAQLQPNLDQYVGVVFLDQFFSHLVTRVGANAVARYFSMRADR